MSFANRLNEYIEELNCSLMELAEKSGLSIATISRYSSGSRIPKHGSDAIIKLSHGIAAIAKSEALDYTEDDVFQALYETLNQNNYSNFAEHFDLIVSTLGINLADLAKKVNFDSSYLSRIRKGQRTPANIDEFVSNLCLYIIRKYSDSNSLDSICELLNSNGHSDSNNVKYNKADLLNQNSYYTALTKWFSEHLNESENKMNSFLKQLNDFDLSEYIRSIHFDELKVPSVPFQFPTSRTCYGIKEMKQGELDFFKGTVLSKSKEPIFMCSDMPMEEMAKDLEFGKKWMFAIAMCIKKGLHINIIHNIDRPFAEMMLGLESWIPIYMTGQISPYHLKNVSTAVYHHINYVSGYMALSGECIDGFSVDEGKYYLTNNKEEVSYYRIKSERLLSKASPLMDIYTFEQANNFTNVISTLPTYSNNRRNILSSLPVYTISDELLDEILMNNDLSPLECDEIKNYVTTKKEHFYSIIETRQVVDEFSTISEQEFKDHPLSLPLSEIFFQKDVVYTYDQYKKHLSETKNISNSEELYSFTTSETPGFRNIQIQIIEDELVLISKSKAPTIHFMIRHPKMVSALQNFIIPVVG